MDKIRPYRAVTIFHEVAAVPIAILLYWRQLPQRPDRLWGLALVPSAAILSRVNDPAVSYRWTEEICIKRNRSQKVNLLLFRRKPAKRFAQKMSQPDALSTLQSA